MCPVAPPLQTARPLPLQPPSRVFAPEFLAWLAGRDEPVTAAAADSAGPWHVERDPKGGWAVLRQGESFKKSTRTIPTATFERREAALLGAAVLPGTGRRLRYRLASEADDRGHPILLDGRVVGHSEYFWEDFVAAINVLDALTVSPRAFALLLDAMGGLALEHVEKIALARLAEPGRLTVPSRAGQAPLGVPPPISWSRDLRVQRVQRSEENGSNTTRNPKSP